MAYSTNPNLPKARAFAIKLLIIEQLPLNVVANRCGVHRTTVWRWKKKWQIINENVSLRNYNRPNRALGSIFRIAAIKWLIPTHSSRPHTFSSALDNNIVKLVLKLRDTLKRCAEVIHHHLSYEYGIKISLSSVRRILKRNFRIHGRRKRVRPDNPMRPHATRPGELVQTDTIYFICPITKRRRYVYTVIDIYSRMAYCEVNNKILPGIASKVILNASDYFGFKFMTVQADNGLEYSGYFKQVLNSNNISVRHSRLGRPNDNAHIERFNRTIQEECTGNYLSSKTTNKELQSKITKYLEYYNTKRVHLGKQLRTPVSMLQRS